MDHSRSDGLDALAVVIIMVQQGANGGNDGA